MKENSSSKIIRAHSRKACSTISPLKYTDTCERARTSAATKYKSVPVTHMLFQAPWEKRGVLQFLKHLLHPKQYTTTSTDFLFHPLKGTVDLEGQTSEKLSRDPHFKIKLSEDSHRPDV